MNHNDPRVYWLTGLSGAGKSTLAGHLRVRLVDEGILPVLVDGDTVRDLLLEPSGYTRENRLQVAQFHARLCRFLVLQGQTVICPTISLFHEIQRWNRENIPGYFEVFLDVDLDTLRGRDTKGLYRAYDSGKLEHVVGLDIKAEFPEFPDARLYLNADSDPKETAEELYRIIRGYM